MWADLAEKAPTMAAWRCDPGEGLVHGSGLGLTVNVALGVRCRQAAIMQPKCPVGDPWHMYGESRRTPACVEWSVIPRDSGRLPRVGRVRVARTPSIEHRRSTATGRDDGLLGPVASRTDRDHENPVGQTPGRAAGSEPDAGPHDARPVRSCKIRRPWPVSSAILSLHRLANCRRIGLVGTSGSGPGGRSAAAATTPIRIVASFHATIALHRPGFGGSGGGKVSHPDRWRVPLHASPVDRNEAASVMTVPLRRCQRGVMFLFAE